MRLDYDQLAECVDRLVGTTRSAEEVAEKVAGTGARIDAASLEKLEAAAPACESCAVRGLGSAMQPHPRGGMMHEVCV